MLDQRPSLDLAVLTLADPTRRGIVEQEF